MNRRQPPWSTSSDRWGKAAGCAIILLLVICLWLPALAAAQTEIKLNAAQKRQLDTFFSNFSEVAMESFKQDSLSQETLLKFALHHILYNNYKSLKTSQDGNTAIIPLAMVDRVTERYFGQKVKKDRQAEYRIPASSGEAHWFSQIAKLTQAGKDLFHAEGVIYVTGSGSTVDVHADPASYQKSGEDEVDRLGTFTALIKKLKAGQERYIMLEYQVVNTSNKPGESRQ